MIDIIPNWHPIFVHFTVTLLAITGVLQILIWLFKTKFNSDSIVSTQKWLVILGSLAIVLTIATGLQAYYSVNHDTVSHLAMTNHRNWALITAIIFLLGAVLYFLFPKRKQVLGGGLFVIAALLLSITAFKGGELVYKHGLGVMSMPVVTGDGHDHDHGSEVTTSKKSDISDNLVNDDGHSDYDHQPAILETTNESEDSHGDHEHEPLETVVPSTDLNEEHTDHDHGDEQTHENKSQVSNELMSGLETQAAKTVIAFHKALISGNAEAARPHLNEAIVIFEGGGVERSAEEYASHHMLSDMSFLKELKITSLEHQVNVNGNMAVSMSRSQMQGVFNDKEIDIQSMETIVLNKVNEQWKIIHIHWSN
jgi:uncharacterized membrane protein/ketosteroid isomerase-like protein